MHIFYKVRLKFKSYTVLFFSLSEDVLWRSFHLMVTLYPLVQLYHMYLTYGSSQRIWTRDPLPHSSFFRICLSFSLVCLFFLPMGVLPIVHAVYPPTHTTFKNLLLDIQKMLLICEAFLALMYTQYHGRYLYLTFKEH